MDANENNQIDSQSPSPRADKALKLFFEGYSCSQSIAGAFADVLNLSTEEAMRLTAGFGAGMGDHKSICGTVSGMIVVAGAHKGDYAPNDLRAKKELYDLVKSLKAEFEQKFETTNCNLLLQKAACLPKPAPSERNAEYYAKRPCASFVDAAARILEKHINS